MSATPNFNMPLLFAAQAQKEITHNEAIVLIDALLTGGVQGVANDPASLAPADGQAWIIGSSPVGTWSECAGQVAVFTPGGWRHVPAAEGMRLYDRAATAIRMYSGTVWSDPVAVAAPAGGTVTDSEARTAIAAIVAALRESGIIAKT